MTTMVYIAVNSEQCRMIALTLRAMRVSSTMNQQQSKMQMVGIKVE